MSDNPVLDLVRAIRGDIVNLRADLGEVKERLGLLEASVASLCRRTDRMGGDVELIKSRLDLVEAS